MPTPAYLVGGSGLNAFLSEAIKAPRSPTTSDKVSPDGSPYQIGRNWLNETTGNIYTYVGGSLVWVLSTPSTGDVSSLAGDSGSAVPVAGVVTIAGGTNLTSSGAGSTLTMNLDATLSGITSVSSGTFTTSSSTLGTTYTANSITASGSDANIDIDITPKGTGSIIYSASRAGSDLNMQITNADNTNAATTAGFQAAVGGATAGDPYVEFDISGVQSWKIGADNSVNDDFVIAASNALGTANAASWTVAGAMTNTGTITVSTAGEGISLPVATASDVTTVVLNSRVGSATFTGSTIAAGATQTLTVTNSTITGASTLVMYMIRGVTAGAAVGIVSVTNGAGTSAVQLTNGTGATAQGANLILDFIVLN